MAVGGELKDSGTDVTRDMYWKTVREKCTSEDLGLGVILK